MASSKTVEEVLRDVGEYLYPGDWDYERGCSLNEITIDSRSCEGDTPLHVLAWQKDVEGTRLLVEAGADVNAIGDMGQTPLHVAVGNDNPALVELLLRAGADPNIISGFGQTAKERVKDKCFEVVSQFK